MAKKSWNRDKKDYDDDDWGPRRDSRKRYDKVKAAIKKARQNKRKNQDQYLNGKP